MSSSKRHHMKLLLLVISMMLSSSGFAQHAEDSVKQVINKFFAALKEGSGDGIRECLADSAVLQTIAKDDSQVRLIREEVDVFVNYVSRFRSGDADEQVTFASVHIDADLATVWAPYKFFFKGNFRHCGINAFQLVRLHNEWKIISIIDTRRKDNCP